MNTTIESWFVLPLGAIADVDLSLALPLGAMFVAVLALVAAVTRAWTTAVVDDPRGTDAHPDLAWPWRAAWPFVRRMAPALAPAIGVLQRERLRESLARAGMDGALSAEQFVAGQCLGCVAAAIAIGLAANASGIVSPITVLPAAVLGALVPRVALSDRIARRRHAILRQLPHDLDLVTLSVEAGLNLGAALGQAAQHGPRGALRDEWQRVLRDVHAGQPRHEALRAMAARIALPAVSNLVAALLAAERQGASLGPILRAQAEQRRTERFLRAERLAMEAPVKMLFPLVLCIFPGTFAVLLFPVAWRLLSEGVL